MLQLSVQPLKAETLSPEDFQKALTTKAVYEFLEAAEQDEALKLQLQAAPNPEQFVEIAADRGFEFTVPHLFNVLYAAKMDAEYYADEEEYELSEEELEMVAGGGRRASVNSFFHESGVVFESGECVIGREGKGRSTYVSIIEQFLSLSDWKAAFSDWSSFLS